MEYKMKTERLKVRYFKKDDLNSLYNLLSDEEVMRYIEPPFSMEKTEKFLNDVAITEDPLIYAVEDLDRNFVGYVIYHSYDDESYELGWIFNRNFWGKGYARELTEAFTLETFKKRKDLIIECDVNQETSKKIALDLGFQFIGISDGCDVYRKSNE